MQFPHPYYSSKKNQELADKLNNNWGPHWKEFFGTTFKQRERQTRHYQFQLTSHPICILDVRQLVQKPAADQLAPPKYSGAFWHNLHSL